MQYCIVDILRISVKSKISTFPANSFQVGGFGPHGITNQIAYFSPQKIWIPLTTIPHIECTNFGCSVLQNTLYVIGGCFNQTDSLATLTEHVHPFGFAYNPRKDSWSRIAPMNRERCRFTLVPCGRDKLVAIGGSGKGPSIKDILFLGYLLPT